MVYVLRWQLNCDLFLLLGLTGMFHVEHFYAEDRSKMFDKTTAPLPPSVRPFHTCAMGRDGHSAVHGLNMELQVLRARLLRDS